MDIAARALAILEPVVARAGTQGFSREEAEDAAQEAVLAFVNKLSRGEAIRFGYRCQSVWPSVCRGRRQLWPSRPKGFPVQWTEWTKALEHRVPALLPRTNRRPILRGTDGRNGNGPPSRLENSTGPLICR